MMMATRMAVTPVMDRQLCYLRLCSFDVIRVIWRAASWTRMLDVGDI